MKYFLAFALVVVVFEAVFAETVEELGERAKKVMEKCIEINKLNQEQVRSVFKFEKLNEKPVKCFLACMAKEMDFMRNENTFDQRKITTTLEPLMEALKKEQKTDVADSITKIIETCVPLQKGSGDECAAAGKAYECLVENSDKLDFLPKRMK